MSRRAPIIGIAVLSIGGGLGMAAMLTAGEASAFEGPVDEVLTEVADASINAQATVPAVTSQIFAEISTAKAEESVEFKTGDLPGERVVPMQDFRVGPFYGRVGGPHTGGVHGGLDMGADSGEPIYSVSDGKVVTADWQGAAGKAVTIKTESGKYVLYGHMSRISVEAGDKVKAGDKIGYVGSTGNSTGPHLHLQVNRPNGASMDPLNWLDVSAKELIKEGRD